MTSENASSSPEKTAAGGVFFKTENYHAKVFQMIAGYRISQVVRTAAMLNFAEHLADGASTPAEIAEAESLDPDATLRLMRACVVAGLLHYEGDLKFSATPLLQTLHKDSPSSLRGVALAQAGPGQWMPFSNLTEAIRTGEAQTKATLGCDLWEHYRKSPEEGSAFNQAMALSTARVAHEVAEHVDTSNVSRVMDVGGGSGTLVHTLMQANPQLKGAVLDLPPVAPESEAAAQMLGIQDRFTAISGDFFQHVPSADLYLLKWILHDWSDEECLSILRNCRQSIEPGGRIVLVEIILPELHQSDSTAIVDLVMMTVVGGRERTLKEFEKLLSLSGFRFQRATSISAPLSIIEAEAE